MTKINTHAQRAKSICERFYEKTIQSGDCILWTSAITTRGYGVFYVDKSRPIVHAHRYALEVHLGRPLLEGMLVLHSCDTPACVNPRHLREGTALENLREASDRGRVAYGERNGGGKKLKEIDVMGIFLRKGLTSGAEEAKRFGVSKHVANSIRRKKIWKQTTSRVEKFPKFNDCFASDYSDALKAAYHDAPGAEL